MSDPLVVSIGWDVRGWRSKEQATAVLGIFPETPKVRWLGISPLFPFKPGTPLGFDSLVVPAVGEEGADLIRNCPVITIAIDAPLAFPADFIRLIEGEAITQIPTKREIDNPLAYRACEHWVHDAHGKKPLSSSFDKLGNNATLAMSICNSLREEGFSVVPQDGDLNRHTAIEVYPGITKVGPKKINRAIPPVDAHIPPNLEPGTDQYDAAICAIMGAVYGGGGSVLSLPDLGMPLVEMNPTEGWIFSFPPDYLKQYLSE